MTTATAGLNQVLMPHEACEVLRVSRRQLADLLKSGSLRGVRLAGQWRIRREDLTAFLDAGGVQPADAAAAV